MDDAFLRAVAVLQAHLKVLDSEQSTLNELQDMQALHRLKSELADYIEAHASKGHLPPDPLSDIAPRLQALDEFFLRAEYETHRLLEWKSDWLEGIPFVGLEDLQRAMVELEEMQQGMPALQEELRGLLDPLDWSADAKRADLHPELRICAEAFPELKQFPSADRSSAMRDFACDSGPLLAEVLGRLRQKRQLIHDLISLHAQHAEMLRLAEEFVASGDIHSAETLMGYLDEGFSDLPYASVSEGLRKLQECLGEFLALEGKVKAGEWSKLEQDLARLRYQANNAIKEESELGKECLPLLQQAESQLAQRNAERKSRRVATAVVAAVVGTFIVACIFIMQANRAAEQKLESDRAAALAADEKRAEAAAIAEQQRLDSLAKQAKVLRNGFVGQTVQVSLPGEVTLSFAYCPAGDFTMGSPTSEENRFYEENPIPVEISEGFWLAQTELTRGQWRAMTGNAGNDDGSDQLPVQRVSWKDAQNYITRLNQSGVAPVGWKFVLPSEAQWEYACRAGEVGPYSGGALDEIAWHKGNSGGVVHEVATKKPNAWGLHDMHGNVREWCSDWYGKRYLGGVDPLGPEAGTRVVVRGGSYSVYGDAAYCRAASRDSQPMDTRDSEIGFRVALVPLRL